MEDESISAREANQSFSRLLGKVPEGRSFIVTSRGRPVARIAPVEDDVPLKSQALARLLDRLRSQKPVQIGKWSREQLYERESR